MDHHDQGPGGTHEVAARWMLHAIEQGQRGLAVDPNPRVGAVIVDAAGQLVGAGHHAGAGTPHAEVVALADSGDRARGGTAYVTLEPCAHQGRTGPCAEALLKAGVRTVVYAVPDPGEVSRGGAARLRDGGVEVVDGSSLPTEVVSSATALAQPWLASEQLGRPLVIWKFAATLDGRSAAADGTSQWITSAEARADVHDLRAACGAVLIGTGTAQQDDPALTVRHPDGGLRGTQPLRVIVGRRTLPTSLQVFDGAAPSVQIPSHDPHQVLTELRDRGVRRALLEGGPQLAGAFLRAGVVDQVIAYLAPALLGAGPAALAGAGIGTIADILRLDTLDVRTVGPDIRITAAPRRDTSPTATTTSNE